MDKVTQTIIKTLLYADLFAWPLAEDELYQKAQTAVVISQKEFTAKLKSLVKQHQIGYQSPYYFLPTRQDLVSRRQSKIPIFTQKIHIAQKFARILKNCPGVVAICLTGSLAVGNPKLADDIDFLIITKTNQLWFTRLCIVALSQLLGIRRMPNSQQIKDKVCLNIFMEKDNLTIPKPIQNLFTAHELVQLQVLVGPKDCYQRIILHNPWLKKYLAHINLNYQISEKKPVSSQNQILSLINKISYRLQAWYMRPKRSRELIAYHSVFFHPQNKAAIIMDKFCAGKKRFGLI